MRPRCASHAPSRRECCCSAPAPPPTCRSRRPASPPPRCHRAPPACSAAEDSQRSQTQAEWVPAARVADTRRTRAKSAKSTRSPRAPGSRGLCSAPAWEILTVSLRDGESEEKRPILYSAVQSSAKAVESYHGRVARRKDAVREACTISIYPVTPKRTRHVVSRVDTSRRFIGDRPRFHRVAA